MVIDLFSDDDAQLLHVKRDVETGLATVNTVDTYRDSCHILDDLEARASDLLQANGIVWVEGPSDRIYFNEWVNIWSNNELRDGEHYECLTYGGSVISHLSGEPEATSVDDEDMKALISILRINRNLIFFADSDRRTEDQDLKPNLNRIQTELTGSEMMCWITEGREVENYIPADAIRKTFALDGFESPDTLSDYYEALKEATDRKSFKKVKLARRIAKELNREMLANTLDLADRLDQACALIRCWNGLPRN